VGRFHLGFSERDALPCGAIASSLISEMRSHLRKTRWTPHLAAFLTYAATVPLPVDDLCFVPLQGTPLYFWQLKSTLWRSRQT